MRWGSADYTYVSPTLTHELQESISTSLEKTLVTTMLHERLTGNYLQTCATSVTRRGFLSQGDNALQTKLY